MKTIVITGASSGIGLALANEYFKLGDNVVMGARSVDKLTTIAGELNATNTPNRALAVACDVTVEEECKKLIDAAVTAFGGVDICICNAGISMRALFDTVDLKVLHQLMDVNFWGTVYCVKYALPYIQEAKGSVVGVSSVAGFHGLPGRTGYSASKYAMHGFLDTIRIENLKKGVHVMIAAPGFTATNVRFSALTSDGTAQGATPREEGKMMTPEQVAKYIIRGVKHKKREVVMDFDGRATKLIKKFAPSFLDKLFYKHMAKEPNSPLS